VIYGLINKSAFIITMIGIYVNSFYDEIYNNGFQALQAANVYIQNMQDTMTVYFIISFLGPIMFSPIAIDFLINVWKRYNVSKHGTANYLQFELNQVFKGLDFQVSQNLGWICKMLSWVTFFGMLYPILFVFSIGGLIVVYWWEKYLLTKHSGYPKIMSSRACDAIPFSISMVILSMTLSVFTLFTLKNTLEGGLEGLIILFGTIVVVLFYKCLIERRIERYILSRFFRNKISLNVSRLETSLLLEKNETEKHEISIEQTNSFSQSEKIPVTINSTENPEL